MKPAILLVRRLVSDELEAYRASQFPGTITARSALPRLAVHRTERDGHHVTLYGGGPLWRPHAHYYGPHGHWRCRIERVVENPTPITDKPPAELEADYRRKLIISAQRPYLSCAQIERLWRTAEELDVPELVVYELRMRMFPHTEIAQLHWREYDRLLKAVEAEGERLKCLRSPAYAEAKRALLQRLRDELLNQ